MELSDLPELTDLVVQSDDVFTIMPLDDNFRSKRSFQKQLMVFEPLSKEETIHEKLEFLNKPLITKNKKKVVHNAEGRNKSKNKPQ